MEEISKIFEEQNKVLREVLQTLKSLRKGIDQIVDTLQKPDHIDGLSGKEEQQALKASRFDEDNFKSEII